MKINRLNDSFSDIGTVVFYRKHKFLPPEATMIQWTSSGEEIFKSDLIKYYGSDKDFPSIDFAEYNFSYFPDKSKFRNTMLLSELDMESGELIGRSIQDTSKISDILFPTLVEDDTSNPYSYFGSLLINGKVLYFFEVPEDYMTIEIYEDVLESNIIGGEGFYEYEYLKLINEENKISPSVVINLGPSREVFNNPTDLYYFGDPMFNRVNRKDESGNKIEYTTYEYSKLYDEVTSSKIISFFLSPNSDFVDFNISYAAWENNSNPLRNKWKYDLRSDENLENLGIIETESNLILDSRSSTILGNRKIDHSLCPIKSRKIEKLRRLQMDSYSPYRRYNKGDIAIYKILHSNGTYTTYTLESLIQGNIGNDPFLSGAWMLKDKFLDFLTNIIYISLDPEGTESVVNPGTQITVRADSNIEFSISEGIGYRFNDVSIILRNLDNEVHVLEKGVDYFYNFEETETEYLKTVVINNWSSFIDPNSYTHTDNITFGFTQEASVLKILAKKSGVLYNYNEWGDELGLELIVKIDGNEVNIGESSPLQVIGDDLFLFISNPQLNPTLEIEINTDLLKDKIESNYRIGSRKYTKTIEISDSISSDIVDFSEATWTINLDSITRELNVNSYNVNCNVSGIVDVNYGSTYTISFTRNNTFLTTSTNSSRISISIINYYYTLENNRLVKYDNEVSIENYPYNGSLLLDGVETGEINLSFDDTTNIYYLTLSNIIENIMVQIID